MGSGSRKGIASSTVMKSDSDGTSNGKNSGNADHDACQAGILMLTSAPLSSLQTVCRSSCHSCVSVARLLYVAGRLTRAVVFRIILATLPFHDLNPSSLL